MQTQFTTIKITIMKHFFSAVFICISFFCKAQNLIGFTTTLQTTATGKNYLSISQKKSFTQAEAKSNKNNIDLALIITSDNGKSKIQWSNMCGKDTLIPKEMTGTNTLINAISFDKEQFNQCKTNQDLRRMTGHITNNAFSHFASVSDDIEMGTAYHCFIIQSENGKRALIWIDTIDGNTYTVAAKQQN